MRIAIILVFLLSSCKAQSQKHIYFLHNAFLETVSPDSCHAEYGKCEYAEILSDFRNKGFEVHSELREKGTSGTRYAEKISMEIEALIKSGVKPADISVIGTSKGGYIAQWVSDILKNKDINYVFIGCCDEDISDMPDIKYYGNILSIHESSDAWGSCKPMRDRSGTGVTRFKEIELNTGMRHGFLYKALDKWMQPSVLWAQGNYDSVSSSGISTQLDSIIKIARDMSRHLNKSITEITITYITLCFL